MSEIASGFKNYYILGVNMHNFEKSTISRFLIVCLPNVVHLENAWKQDFRFEFKRTFIPLCMKINTITMQAKLQLLHQNCNELSMGPMQVEKKIVPVRPIKI